jgi:hypothetical protein
MENKPNTALAAAKDQMGLWNNVTAPKAGKMEKLRFCPPARYRHCYRHRCRR